MDRPLLDYISHSSGTQTAFIIAILIVSIVLYGGGWIRRQQKRDRAWAKEDRMLTFRREDDHG